MEGDQEPVLATPEQITAAVDVAPAPETQAAPEASQTPAMSRVEMARSLGFTLPEDATDDSVSSSLKQYQELATIGRQWKTDPSQFAGFFQQATQPAPQAQQTDTGDPWSKQWVAPVDAGMIAQCRYDEETGGYVAKNEFVPQAVVQKVNEYATEIARRQNDFWKNPHKTIYDGIKEPLLNELREEIRREYAEQQRQAEEQEFNAGLTDKFYAKDAAGNYSVNPVTGEYASTPWGTAYSQSLQQIAAMGVQDTLAAKKWAAQQADLAVKSQAPTVPASPPKTPQQASQEKKEAFLNGAVNGAISGHPNGSIYEPSGMTDFEHENLFINRARAQGLYVEAN